MLRSNWLECQSYRNTGLIASNSKMQGTIIISQINQIYCRSYRVTAVVALLPRNHYYALNYIELLHMIYEFENNRIEAYLRLQMERERS